MGDAYLGFHSERRIYLQSGDVHLPFTLICGVQSSRSNQEQTDLIGHEAFWPIALLSNIAHEYRNMQVPFSKVDGGLVAIDRGEGKLDIVARIRQILMGVYWVHSLAHQLAERGA